MKEGEEAVCSPAKAEVGGSIPCTFTKSDFTYGRS